MARSQKSHRTRFASWCKLGGKPLMTLASLVESQLVQSLLAAGFEWVDVYYRQSDEPNSGSDIVLERGADSDIEQITFNFDKYHRPAFQIHLGRRGAEPPQNQVRFANLVKRNTQYFHFWGKPWWVPTRFWSEHKSARTVATIVRRLDQALAFLERGERGPNISRPITIEPQNGTRAGIKN